MILTKPTWSFHIFFAAKWVRIFVKQLKSLDCQKSFQKVKEVFVFLDQRRAVAAFEHRELRHGPRMLPVWRDPRSGFERRGCTHHSI